MLGGKLLEDSFVEIDFESATSKRSSVCAVGVVVFEDGLLITKRKLLIRPPGNKYYTRNMSIHGIKPSDTCEAPEFPYVWDQVVPMPDDRGSFVDSS
ncbi:MAG: hypothetical protein OXI96_03485 [Acidimicrobiaceae bacterium]|nr:hypothetical protein [Acidimicrobiaceae bacterium]